MNFFEQLSSLSPGLDISIRVKRAKDGTFAVSVLPQVPNKTTEIKPLVLAGTPAELDERFFALVTAPLQQAEAKLLNAEEFVKSFDEAAKETAVKKNEKPTNKKSGNKKAVAKEKPIKKVSADKGKVEKKTFPPLEDGKPRMCRVCGCTDNNCAQCIEKTGEACHWVEADLCSACVDEKEKVASSANKVAKKAKPGTKKTAAKAEKKVQEKIDEEIKRVEEPSLF